MAISLDKVLTISAKEWFDITGNDKRNYEPIGVQVQFTNPQLSIHQVFADNTPNAEVVIAYQAFICRFCETGLYGIAQGTALVRKK